MAAVFLLYTSQRPDTKQALVSQDESDLPSAKLVEQIMLVMGSIATQAGGELAGRVAKSIRVSVLTSSILPGAIRSSGVFV